MRKVITKYYLCQQGGLLSCEIYKQHLAKTLQFRFVEKVLSHTRTELTWRKKKHRWKRRAFSPE